MRKLLRNRHSSDDAYEAIAIREALPTTSCIKRHPNAFSRITSFQELFHCLLEIMLLAFPRQQVAIDTGTQLTRQFESVGSPISECTANARHRLKRRGRGPSRRPARVQRLSTSNHFRLAKRTRRAREAPNPLDVFASCGNRWPLTSLCGSKRTAMKTHACHACPFT